MSIVLKVLAGFDGYQKARCFYR